METTISVRFMEFNNILFALFVTRSVHMPFAGDHPKIIFNFVAFTPLTFVPRIYFLYTFKILYKMFSTCFLVEGTSTDQCTTTYSGPSPFSEPETLAVKRVLENKNINFLLYISFHSYGQYWMYPWGYTSTYTKDVKLLVGSFIYVGFFFKWCLC